MPEPWRSSSQFISTFEPAGTALSAVALLPVKGRAPKTGYTRVQFGHRWADVDHNG